MTEARVVAFEVEENEEHIIHPLPPDADSLRQHCLRANYLPYIMRHLSLRHRPSPLGQGCELVGGRCLNVVLLCYDAIWLKKMAKH